MANLKERKARLLKLIRSFDEAETNPVISDDIELEETDEQIPEELEADDLDVVDTEEEADADEFEGEDELEDLEDGEDLEANEFEETEEDETFDVADDEEEALVELPEDEDDDTILSDDEEDLSFLDDEEDSVTASEVEIGDEAHGGDPSVSEITDSDVDVNTDAEVFPTDSEYVARITAKLDKVANYLEKTGKKRMAYRLDVLSDKLEKSVRK